MPVLETEGYFDLKVPDWQREQGVDYSLMSSIEDLNHYIDSIPKGVKVAFDTETTGLDPEVCDIVGFSLAYKEKSAVYVPISHIPGKELNLPRTECFAAIRKLLDNHPILAFHIKFDGDVLEYICGITPGSYTYEDVLASVYLDDPNEKSKGLKASAKRYFSIEMLSYTEMLIQKKTRAKVEIGFNTVHPVVAVPYAAADADIALRLYNRLAPAREEQAFIYKIETALTEIIRTQEKNRFLIDVSYLKRLEIRLSEKVEALRKEIHALAGQEFEIDSPDKLGKIIFEHLNLRFCDPFDDYRPKKPTTDAGKLSTEASVLEWMIDVHPIIPKILEYRSYTKQLSTYVHALQNGLNEKNEAKFNYFQYQVPTGRLAAGSDRSTGKEVRPGGYMNVNVHSIPKNYAKKIVFGFPIPENSPKSQFHISSYEGVTYCLGCEESGIAFVKAKLEKKGETLLTTSCTQCDNVAKVWGFYDVSPTINIRKAFKARPGFKIVAIDYSQIELRIAAALSGEQIWIDAYNNNQDLHAEMSMKMFGSSDPSLRVLAKQCNFGNLFGGSAYTLANQAKVAIEKARQAHDAWTRAVRGYVSWTKLVHQEAERDGFVKTYFGRKRPIPWFNKRELRGYAQRSAVNTKVQGTAADVLKIALFRINSMIKKNSLQNDCRQLLNVHDEGVFEVRESKIEEIVPQLVKAMEIPIKDWPVKLIAEPEVGDNWGELVDLDVYSKYFKEPVVTVPDGGNGVNHVGGNGNGNGNGNGHNLNEYNFNFAFSLDSVRNLSAAMASSPGADQVEFCVNGFTLRVKDVDKNLLFTNSFLSNSVIKVQH